jgi:FAD/FMN-containing dehydrogenase/Fe-S oxidoreductase
MQDLEAQLRHEVEGDVFFDSFSRGRYSTDASIYQIEPIGVVCPASRSDAERALSIAAERKIPLLPRGAGTSQCGQAVGRALVVDSSRYLDNVLEIDSDGATAWVEPGVVLDQLNATLRPLGLWFPVDVSTSAQATIGGMTANNSCGARSIRYGNMVHNVLAVDAWLSTGELVRLEDTGLIDASGRTREKELTNATRRLYAREKVEIANRVPKVRRRVAGYNLDLASEGRFNMAHLLVGSEGTLAYFRRIKLRLSPIPAHKVLGVVHFPTFYDAMNLTQDIVRLDPDAVELIDKTMIGLSRRIPAFRSTVEMAIKGTPDAVLLVEFAGDDRAEQLAKLKRLSELMADLRLPDSVVGLTEPGRQAALWEIRKAGLNIMMSMKGDGKPVSFIEDCAVPLEHLAEYTARLTEVFRKHGTRGTWYAHASVGCLHVRPVLDMRSSNDVKKMRAIAEEACALVRQYKGSYSGEHGDGLVRSEWIEAMYGNRLATAFAELKKSFDPAGLMNPGKIVAPTKMDRRELFRYPPGYTTARPDTELDWSMHEIGEHNKGRGFAAAVEMCNNNGHCRKFDAGTMCPSFRVTRNEKDLTRGRANSLRLALSGQLGPEALTSRDMYETMELCVSCKGCRRECPTGVDMARMKIEFLNQYHAKHPRSRRDTLIAHLPRYAPRAAAAAAFLNLRDKVPGLARLSELGLGLSARRSLPRWRRDWFRGKSEIPQAIDKDDKTDVVLFADTFNTYFEPENLRAAVAVLSAAGFRVHSASAPDGDRPLCCGRTYLAAGMVEEARIEARRTLDALAPWLSSGMPIIGIEPACLYTFKDEFQALLPGPETEALAKHAATFEEFVVEQREWGRLGLALRNPGYERALVHGHCHQKAFGGAAAVATALRLIPDLDVAMIQSGCCGMAGAFGYESEHVETSFAMGELALLPAVREASQDTVIVADGTSCRHQIADGTGRRARHAACVIADALEGKRS